MNLRRKFSLLILFFGLLNFSKSFTKPTAISVSKILPLRNSLSARKKLHSALISVVLNNCKESIKLFDAQKNEILIRPGTVHLKTALPVPFASIKEHLKQIIEDIPYIPKNALRIDTPHGTYGLWEDERGIQACIFEKELLDDSYVQKVIGKEKLLTALTLTLCIEEKGLSGFVDKYQ